MPTLKLMPILAISLLLTASTHADIVSVEAGNMNLISTNAINTTTITFYDVTTGFDGIINETQSNGAVFDLSQQNPSIWNVDLIGVSSISTMNLYQMVGAFSDNGIEDFNLTFYSGDNLGGTVIHSENFTGLLSTDNKPQIFALGSTVFNPESFSITVNTSFGSTTRSEFSEITFSGSLGVAVPEPSSMALVFLATVGFMGRRKRA